jgi:hypothetical protein
MKQEEDKKVRFLIYNWYNNYLTTLLKITVFFDSVIRCQVTPASYCTKKNKSGEIFQSFRLIW